MSSISYYLNLRDSIKAQLFEDSENSVQNITQTLAWNDSIYRTFNEGLRLAAANKRKIKRIPKSLVEYVHIAHISYVVIALRKLYENKKSGQHSINSIRTIIQQIDDNKHTITRENYLTHDSTPYEDRDNLDWRTRFVVQSRHNLFDRLCGLRPGCRRKRNDSIDPLIPNSLQKYAVLHQNIAQYADKFLAHASARTNRPYEKLALESVYLKKIQHQYKNVIWSIQQIAKIVDETIITEVEVPLFDALTDWEHGIFDNVIKARLDVYWQKRMEWWGKWTYRYRDSNIIFLSPVKRM